MRLSILLKVFTRIFTIAQTKRPIFLFSSNKRILNQGSEDLPDVTIDEIIKALNSIKNNKASNEDQITIDSTEAGGELFSRL